MQENFEKYASKFCIFVFFGAKTAFLGGRKKFSKKFQKAIDKGRRL